MSQINPMLSYENALSSLLKLLGLSPSLCQFIRALILASKGQKTFNVSHRELAGFYRKCTPETIKADVQSVKDKFKSLKKWEADSQIQLVRIVKEGNRKMEDGKFTFTTSEYELIGLSELTALIHSTSEHELETEITNAIVKLKKQYKPTVKKRGIHPKASIKRAKKTIFTNFERIFALWEDKKQPNPTPYCQSIINELQTRLYKMEDEHIHSQNRKKRIANFEALRKSSNNSPQSTVSAQ